MAMSARRRWVCDSCRGCDAGRAAARWAYAARRARRVAVPTMPMTVASMQAETILVVADACMQTEPVVMANVTMAVVSIQTETIPAVANACVQTEPFRVKSRSKNKKVLIEAMHKAKDDKRTAKALGEESVVKKGEEQWQKEKRAAKVKVKRLPVTFREHVRRVLDRMVPHEWDEAFDFHYDVATSTNARCPGHVGECPAKLECTRCGLGVCAPCAYTHMVDHLSEHESVRATLCEDAAISELLARICHACVAYGSLVCDTG